MDIQNENNLDPYKARIEQERADLIDLKKSGSFCLHSQLEQHPINALVKNGAKLSDNHPLMKLRRQDLKSE